MQSGERSRGETAPFLLWVHCWATFTLELREIISARVCDCGLQKCAARLRARSGSVFAPAMAFCACSVLVGSGTGEGDEGGGEFHLWIVTAKMNGVLDEHVTVETLRAESMRILLSHSLVGLRRDSRGRKRRVRLRASWRKNRRERSMLDEQLFGGKWDLCGVESGAAKSFHVDEDGGVGVEDGRWCR